MINNKNDLVPSNINSPVETQNFYGTVQNVNPNATTVNNSFLRQETNIIIPDSSQPSGIRSYHPSREYYNLFVLGYDENIPRTCQSWSFTVDKERAVREYSSDETREKFVHLTDDVIPLIKTFPSLILNENEEYGKSGSDQYVRKAIITNISKTDNGIRVDCLIRDFFLQQVLNDKAYDFAISSRGRFSELNRTHWAIKQMDLETILAEQGVELLYSI